MFYLVIVSQDGLIDLLFSGLRISLIKYKLKKKVFKIKKNQKFEIFIRLQVHLQSKVVFA